MSFLRCEQHSPALSKHGIVPREVNASSPKVLNAAHVQGDSKDVFNKLGSYAWLAAAILAAELLNVAKLGQGEFTAPFPDHIKIAWGVAGTVFAVSMVAWQIWIWLNSYWSKASPTVKKVQ
jgi:hypothetical protein